MLLANLTFLKTAKTCMCFSSNKSPKVPKYWFRKQKLPCSVILLLNRLTKSPLTCSPNTGGGGRRKCVFSTFFIETFFKSKEFGKLTVNQKLLIKSDHLRRTKNENILPGYIGWPTLGTLK